MKPKDIHKEINEVTEDLISIGLCEDQNFPSFIEKNGNIISISVSEFESSKLLKNVDYISIYNELKSKRNFNIKMVDGAMILFQYEFQNSELLKHRLSYFPSLSLLEFQNNYEIYEIDELYADVIEKQIVTFPMRFDYDSREEVYKVVDHPKSHLTLGQFKNCRIPVSAPITPNRFIHFIIRNFYHTTYKKYCDNIRTFELSFNETIHPDEKKIVYLSI
ncbi:MAG TPA: DUF2290 domain-containing protein [Gallicola sp.]|nr:DUF2290 domain-containing protein [Gallicola sp.]